MNHITTLLLILPVMLATLSFDFGVDCDNCNEWFVVLDGVMGGLSTGKLKTTANSIVLEGKVSLDNNGGFTSVRTPYQEYDLSEYNTVAIRYRSMGQDFAFTLNKYRRFWYPNYKANLPITDGKWITETYELRNFGTYKLEELIDGTPDTDDLANIIRLGFISNTKAATDYTFEVDFVEFR